jgi:biopolymer transport protein ExbD
MRRPSRHRYQPPELNITSFMNLMVILVPFLLITAVFSRMAILELNIPLADASESNKQKPVGLQLEVIIRHDSLEIADRNAGLLKHIDNDDQGYNFKALSNTLKSIKVQTPETTTATILSEPDISYDALIQLMDTVRVVKVVSDGSVMQAELFPDISIGDAPAVNSSGNTR